MTTREHHLSVRRSARYFTLGEPGPAVRGVWMVCHGYGQLAARFLQSFEGLDDGSRLIVAPEGLSRFYVDRDQREKVGASWMTREDRLIEIEDHIAYLDALHAETFRLLGRGALPVTALGFSQGVATVARWAARGNVSVTRLIFWAGTLPPELDLTVFGGSEVTLVCGTHDPLITAKVLNKDEERLRNAGVRYELVAFDGGHDVLPAVLKIVARA